MHILKTTTWQSGNRWYVGDVQDLGHGSGTWWYIPNCLGVSFEDYIYLLKDKYNAKIFPYHAKTNVLIFAFDDYSTANKFSKFVNKKARESHFLV